jgi:membrane protein DedA with SNARE-associated domain
MESVTNYLNEIFFLIDPIYRIGFIFLFALLEGLPVVGTFFPGGTIALFVGILSNEGFISPITAIIIIALGSYVGDITGFFAGKKLKHTKWIKKIVEHEKHQEKWDIFDRHIVLIVLFSRIIPVVRSLPSIFAGARNIKTGKYLALSLVGSFIWATGGVYGGNIISQIAGKLAIPIILGIVVISISITFILNKKKKNN